MSFNFLKSYLPLTASGKRIANFSPEKITIPRPQQLFSKLTLLKSNHAVTPNKFSQSKPERVLQVITDFDYTLTKFKDPESNKVCQAIFGAFVKSPHFPDNFKEQLIKNYMIYGPYETDGTITFSQRSQLINQLYRIQLSLFRKHRITTSMINSMLAEANIIFRAYSYELLTQLAGYQVPLYIISGGISDVIFALTKGAVLAGLNQRWSSERNALDRQTEAISIMNNISIHSNQLETFNTRRYQYDEQFDVKMFGRESLEFVKFKKDIVHSYNKYRIMGNLPVRNYDNQHSHFSVQQRQPDCLLLGDLVSDIYMSRAHPFTTMVSVFYAKEGQTDQRALAQNKFDIIIQGDGSHRFVVELIRIIKGIKDKVSWEYMEQSNSKFQSMLRWL